MAFNESQGSVKPFGSNEIILENDCEPCSFGGKVVVGTAFCELCEEYLCKNCLSVHKNSKATRNHSILQGRDLGKAGRGKRLSSFTQHCENHKGKVLEFYCTTHDVVICVQCKLLEHRECVHIRNVADASRDIQGNDKVDLSLKNATALIKKFRDFTSLRKRDLVELDKDVEACSTEIRTFRKDVLAVLDKLEKDMIYKMTERVEEEKQVIRETMISSEAMSEALAKHLSVLHDACSRGVNEEIFIARKKLGLSKMEQVLEDLEADRHVVKPKFVPDTRLAELISKPKFGELLTELGYENILEFHQFPHADLKDGSIVKAGEKNIREADDDFSCSITACQFLDTDELLLCDNKNRKLKLLDTDMNIRSSVKLESGPWDVAFVSDSVAVAALPVSKKLQYVSLKPQLRLSKTLNIGRRGCAVETIRDEILVSCMDDQGKEVLVMNEKGNVLKTLGVNPDGSAMFSSPFSLSLNHCGSHLYVCDADTNKITCLKMNGTVVRSYTDASVQDPDDVLVDTKGNLYVCSRGTNSIQVLGRDGRSLGAILSGVDGIKHPLSFCYRPTDRTIVIGSSKSDVIQIFRSTQKV